MSPQPQSGEVPQSVQAAAREGAERRPDSWASFALWLEPSWRAAQRLGIGEDEFVAWARLGLWNLEGDQQVVRRVSAYRELAGRRGHLFAAAGVSVEAAQEQVAEHGLSDALEAIEVMQALGAMPSVEAEERIAEEKRKERAEKEKPPDPALDLSDLIGASRKPRR